MTGGVSLTTNYAGNASMGASEANTNNAGNDGNVYDADYKVEDDNK